MYPEILRLNQEEFVDHLVEKQQLLVGNHPCETFGDHLQNQITLVWSRKTVVVFARHMHNKLRSHLAYSNAVNFRHLNFSFDRGTEP